ncbi:MAG TPA: hypothetical protein VMB03_28605 [Bryobacteraceae bacterium]|nr:hypothetical protein [Bryobacteraceae bacterium]
MKTKALPVVVLGLTVCLGRAAAPRPSDADTANLVERTRVLSRNYTRRMPDFLCTQTIRRSYHLTLPKNWIRADVLTVKLRYAGQTEDRELLARNGRPVVPGEPFGGLENIGEFGGMLEAVFDPQSQAEFHWESSKTLRDRPSLLFSYQVKASHSSYMLSFDPGGYVHRQVVGYHGTVWVDRETGGVLRLVYEADTISADFPMQYASTTVDYGFVEVAGRTYLLPVRAEIETDVDGFRSRNISEFKDYRKFSTDSTVHFGDTFENQ